MAKSILKDNQNHTVPILRGDNSNNNNSNKTDESRISINLNQNNNNNNNNNRRVSFAREVTLHKIDYVENPNNKRRKTDIGITYQDYGESSGNDLNLENYHHNNNDNNNGMNNINEQDEHEEEEEEHEQEQGDDTYGEKMLVDSSDEDEQEEEDHVIDVNNNDRRDHEEQTMELTSVGVPEYIPPVIDDGKASTDQQYHRVVVVEEEEEEEEEDMELTEGMPRKFEYSSPKETNVDDQNNDDEDITMDVTNVLSHIRQSANQNQNSVQDNAHSENKDPQNVDDTQPMELTQTLENITRSSIEKPVLQEVIEEQELEGGIEQHGSENKPEVKEQVIDDVVNTEPEEENELDHQIIDNDNREENKPSNISSNDFSEHMDLTIVDYKKIDYNGPIPEIPRGDGFDNGELSFAMDLTEIQLFVCPRNDKENQDDNETGIDEVDANAIAIAQEIQPNEEGKIRENEITENDAMELTQTIPMKILDSNEDTNSISQPLEESIPTSNNLPDESLSQPMELTQIDSKITTGKESDLGEVSQPMDLTQTTSNISHDDEINTSGIEERVTTTTIPLAEITQDDINEEDEREEGKTEPQEEKEESSEEDDEDDSFDEDDPNYIPVSLSKFLSDIRVQFYDDLELDLNSIPRLSITNSIELTPSLHDYIKAKPNLELLELYEFCCHELNKKIIQGRELYNEYEKTVIINNPILFKKYYSMDDKTKLLINLKIQLIRDFARLKSKKTWYDWRNQLIENLIDKLNEEINSLINDKQLLIEDINRLNELYDKCRIYLNILNNKFNELIRLKNEIKQIPPMELNKLQLDVAKRKQDIVEINKEIEIKLLQLSTIKKNLHDSNEKKSLLQIQLNNLQNEFNQIRKYDNLEIKLILRKYQFLQNLTNLKYLKTTQKEQQQDEEQEEEEDRDHKISFLFDDSIICQFDFINNKIMYTMEQNNFKNKSSLIGVFDQIIIDGEKQQELNIIDKFQLFCRNWHWLKKLDSDLYYVSLKFPIELKFVHNNEKEEEENEKKGKKYLEFTIKYYNFKYDYKLLICGEIDINNFVNNQSNVNPKNIEFTGRIIHQRGEINNNNNNKSFREQISNDLKVFDKQILNNLIIVNK